MKNILYIILVVSPLLGFSQVSTQDSLALVDLYNSTGGNSWSNNTNWLSATPVSAWQGVTVKNNRVTQIRLFSNNLTGALPSSIGNLTALDLFFISNNNLTGTLPSSIVNWSNIQRLIVDRNQFSGPIPSFIPNLTSLRQLFLSGNDFSGPILSNLNMLTNLEWLWLDRNQFTGTIPTSLMSMASLKIMGLNDNALTGNIPTGFSGLPNLEYLFVHQNQLDGTIPSDIGDAVNLSELWLNNNSLTGQIPSSLTTLNNLNYLGMEENQLSGTIPDFSATMNNLEWVFANNNNFNGIDGITNSTNLNYYDVSSNELTFTDLEPIASDLAPFVNYSNQDKIDNVENRVFFYNATVSDQAPSNQYQWYRNGSTIGGANNTSYGLFWQSGTYHCEINNPLVPDLTIVRNDVNFRSIFGRPVSNITPLSIITTGGNPSYTGKFLIILDKDLDNYLRENDKSIKFSVVNQVGQLVYEQDYSGFGNKQIDLSNYPTGMYNLITQIEDLTFTNKLVYSK